MPPVSILIKPASSACNISCKYCFYHSIAENRETANFGIMSDENLETLVRETIRYADGFAAFAFQGGEPMLAGLDFFQKAVALQKKYNTKGIKIQNTIQTNGTLMDEEWAEFLSKNKFLVGLSLDGPRGVNDFCRVTRSGESIFNKEMNAVRLFEKYKVDFNVVSVVTSKTAEKIAGIYHFFKDKHFYFMQFIPCLDENENVHSEYSLTPDAYGKFLCRLFDLWYEDFRHGIEIDIRLFSNFAQMAAGYAPEECGMCGKCTTYFVVEANGNVYPCDFYASDEWKLGTLKDGFKNLFHSQKSRRFMESSLSKPQECHTCKYFYLCRGGCRRWRDMQGTGELGLNYLCEAYKVFFKHCETRIQCLGELIRRRMRTYMN